ncbi:MAG: hypothetical protein IPK80_29920 [Nannocystis sp.]|nr:hypothetical protein [Nannocystis sp.]
MRLVHLATSLAVAFTLGLACRPRYSADEPVPLASDGCCKFGNEKMTKFAGCRLAKRCHQDEPIWLNGAVTCGPVEEQRCRGGRCCEFRPRYGAPDAPLNWDDGEAQTNPEPNNPQPHNPQPSNPEPEPEPEPSRD